MKRFDLTGRVAVVTGGTGVLGSAICEGLHEAGATVVALSRNPDAPQVIDVVAADVLDRSSLAAARDYVQQTYGRLDILVNGAGGNSPQATVSDELPFFDVPTEAIQSVFNLNLTGSINTTQVFGTLLAAQKQGVILNISSMASLQPLTKVVAYSAAKAALNNFTQWLAVYMAQTYSPDIRVNAVAPGFFLGEQNRYLLVDKDSGDLTPRGSQIIDRTPMARFGEPDDLIGTVLWLVSDASRFVTGIVVPVDGGFSAYSGV